VPLRVMDVPGLLIQSTVLTTTLAAFLFGLLLLALEVSSEIVLGMIVAPAMHELFYAVKGQGAFQKLFANQSFEYRPYRESDDQFWWPQSHS
jgi:hypothetical protein